MKRVYIVNITKNRGSTGRICEHIGLTAIHNGWEVRLGHGARFCGDSQLDTFMFSNLRSEYLHALRSRLFDGEGLGSKAATRSLIADIARFKPNIVHLNNLHGYFINIPILFDFLAKQNIKTVITMHDVWNVTGHCVHFDPADCTRWKRECHDCPLQKKGPKRSLIDRSRRNFKLKKRIFQDADIHLVVVSDWLGDVVQESVTLSGKPLTVIKNGIDLSIFNTKGRMPQEGKFRILALSNVWHRDKGLQDIFGLRQHLSDEYEIVMVGLTESQLKALPEGIDGHGLIPGQEKLADMYRSCDVLVNPSYADSYSTVNAEAIACGTRVVTYHTGGNIETITPDTGRVVEKGNVEAMARAVEELCATPPSIERCRNFALQNLDKDKCFAKYIDLYNYLSCEAT
ncbi:MAG: glycosyltransferase [Clostridium sp.]|nr:glycosyltransferase [Prevotella sp.]MCM1428390.1 glycosyltransferase [Clostridium sp.]MCM1474862.1 glycosyltransferase [Muribaculaceae bacterium]